MVRVIRSVRSFRQGFVCRLSIAPSSQLVLLEVEAHSEAYISPECAPSAHRPPSACPGDTWVILNTNEPRLAPKWAPASHSIGVSWPASVLEPHLQVIMLLSWRSDTLPRYARVLRTSISGCRDCNALEHKHHFWRHFNVALRSYSRTTSWCPAFSTR